MGATACVCDRYETGVLVRARLHDHIGVVREGIIPVQGDAASCCDSGEAGGGGRVYCVHDLARSAAGDSHDEQDDHHGVDEDAAEQPRHAEVVAETAFVGVAHGPLLLVEQLLVLAVCRIATKQHVVKIRKVVKTTVFRVIFYAENTLLYSFFCLLSR